MGSTNEGSAEHCAGEGKRIMCRHEPSAGVGNSSPGAIAVGDEQPVALRAIAVVLATIETTLVGMDDRIRKLQDQVAGQQNRREWYSVSEAAKLLGKAEFTVREWCRLDRINAHKRECGRGGKREWMISRDELERIRQKGLLPATLSGTQRREPSAR